MAIHQCCRSTASHSSVWGTAILPAQETVYKITSNLKEEENRILGDKIRALEIEIGLEQLILHCKHDHSRSVVNSKFTHDVFAVRVDGMGTEFKFISN